MGIYFPPDPPPHRLSLRWPDLVIVVVLSLLFGICVGVLLRLDVAATLCALAILAVAGVTLARAGRA